MANTIILPVAIPCAFAKDSAYKNVIPDTPSGSYLASWEEGFPYITMIETGLGGTPPDGKDFNGIFNAFGSFFFAIQNGYRPTFSQAVSDLIGGYPQGAVLEYKTDGGQSKPVVSLIANNTYNFVTNPEYIDGVHWAIAMSSNFLNYQDLGNATVNTTVNLTAPGPAVKKLTIPDALSTVALTLTVPNDADVSDAWTYELHIACGATIPAINWALSNSNSIQWLTTSYTQIQEASTTSIFVFRWQNGQLIGNYGGAY